MPQKMIAALAALLLIGGAAVLFFSGLLGGDDAAVGRWKPGDETEVAAEQGAAVQADPNQRTEVGELTGNADGQERIAMVLQGRVVNKFQTPVANAKVWLDFARGGREQARTRRVPEPVTTGHDGVFTFQGQMFRNLRVVLHVVHRDHAPAWFDRNLGETATTVQLGDLPLTSGGDVLGRVTDLDGVAIASAEVRLEPEGNNRIRWGRNREQAGLTKETDRSGMFRFSHAPAGEWRVQAVAKSHQHGSSRPFKVEDDLATEIDDIQLGPGYELTGFVRDLAAKPVAKADVIATSQRGGRDFRVETDAQGHFVLEHLPGSPLTVAVEGDGYLRFEQKNVEAQQQTSPMQITLQDGLKITGMVASAATNQAVTSYAVKANRVRGLPREKAADDATGKLIESAMQAFAEGKGDPAQIRSQIEALRAQAEASGADVTALRDRMREGIEGMTKGGGRGGRGGNEGNGGRGGQAPGTPGQERWAMGGRDGGNMNGGNWNWGMGQDLGKPEPHADGRFTLTGLQEGVYVVAVHAPTHQRWSSAEIELRAGAPVPDVTAALAAGLDVSGTVIDAAGKPIANARVELRTYNPERQGKGRDGARGRQPQADGKGLEGFLRTTATQFMGGGMPVLDARTDGQGRFTIAHAPQGSYRVHASGDKHQPATSEPFELQAAAVSGLVLTLGNLGSLEGKVRGLTSVTIGDARVAAVPLGENLASMWGGRGGARQLMAEVTEDGNYRFDGLAPGNYLVRAFVGMQPDMFRELVPAVLGGGEAPKPDVVIKVGETAKLDLDAKLPDTGSVAGTVTNNGMPAKDFRVDLHRTDESGGNQGGGNQGRGGRGLNAFLEGGNGNFNFGNFGGRSFSASPSNTGRYSMDGVPGGLYELQVSSGRRNTVLYKQTITVVGNKPNPIDIALVTATISGRVLPGEASNEAIQGNVSLLPGLSEFPEDFSTWRRDHQFANARINDGGTFTSDILQPGPYLLVLQVRGRERVTQPVSLLAGQQLQLDLTAGKVAETKPGEAKSGETPEPVPGGRGGNGPGGRGGNVPGRRGGR